MDKQFLVGKKIFLRGLEKNDLENLSFWLSDSSITRFLQQGERPHTIETLQKNYDVESKDDHQISFAIIDKKSKKHIGWTGLYSINWISRYAEMRIFVGDKKFWKKGVATEAQKLLIEYGFDKLNLHRIFAGTNMECKGEQGALQKLFMKKEGVSRDAMFRNGKYYDIIHFGILENEYRNKVKNNSW